MIAPPTPTLPPPSQVSAEPAAVAIARERASAAKQGQPQPLTGAKAGASPARAAKAVVSQIDAVAGAAKLGTKVTHKYTHVLSGFALAGPTPNELKALVQDPAVVAIYPRVLYQRVSPGE